MSLKKGLLRRMKDVYKDIKLQQAEAERKKRIKRNALKKRNIIDR